MDELQGGETKCLLLVLLAVVSLDGLQHTLHLLLALVLLGDLAM